MNDVVSEGTDQINASTDYTNVANVEFLVGKLADFSLTLSGSSRQDRITGANKINSGDNLNGEDGNDKLVGLVTDDVINGSAGNDRIFSNRGDDIIHGVTGNDRSTGRQGADRFIFNVGEKRDRITDFDVSEGTLDFISFGFANEAAALAFATDVDASVEFDFAGQDNLALERGCES